MEAFFPFFDVISVDTVVKSSPHFKNTSRKECRRYKNYWSSELMQLDTESILHWSVDEFAPRLAVATSFGPEGCVLISMLSTIMFSVDVIPIDFAIDPLERETIIQELSERYGVEINLRSYDMPWATALEYDAILCESSHDSAAHRGERNKVLEWNECLNVFRIYPLAHWKSEAILEKVFRESIPCDKDTYSTYHEWQSKRAALSQARSASKEKWLH